MQTEMKLPKWNPKPSFHSTTKWFLRILWAHIVRKIQANRSHLRFPSGRAGASHRITLGNNQKASAFVIIYVFHCRIPFLATGCLPVVLLGLLECFFWCRVSSLEELEICRTWRMEQSPCKAFRSLGEVMRFDIESQLSKVSSRHTY